jgi:hypothetical protein
MPCLAKLSSRFFGTGSVKVRLKAISSCQLMRTSPTTPCPCIRRAQSAASAPLTSIFLGSQPRSAQVPPNGRWSIIATERPAPRTRAAATCAAVPVPMTIAVHPLPFATLFPVQAESNQPDAEDQRRNQHISTPGKPGGQPNRADGGDQQRRGAADRCNHRNNAQLQ